MEIQNSTTELLNTLEKILTLSEQINKNMTSVQTLVDKVYYLVENDLPLSMVGKAELAVYFAKEALWQLGFTLHELHKHVLQENQVAE